MNDRLLMSPPDVGALEEECVVHALRSGWVAPTGPDVTGFEGDVAERCGVDHAVAMASGTGALHLAMIALGVRPGDVVMVSTLTFVASANAVAYTGATPCFLDAEADGNMDLELLVEAIQDQRARGNRVAAVMAVDLLGRVVDYVRLRQVCRDLEVPLIEDPAEALGGTRDGRPAGCFGDVATLSFNGNKIMTTSGGGMLLTNDQGIADHARFLSTQARELVAHYKHHHVGYNYRMSNILAALGRAQLVRLDEMIARRRAHRDRYAAVVSHAAVEVFQRDGDAHDNCWLTSLLIDPDVAPVTASDVRERMEKADIESRPLWNPMHRQPIYADAPGYLNGNAEHLFQRGVTLPSASKHADGDIARVVTELEHLWGDVA